MNKYQEALETLCEAITQRKHFVIKLAIGNLNELVEKATPKKVVDIDTYIDFEEGYTGYSGICPTCREWCYSNHDSCYCGGCGQALDWGEEDE